MNEKTLKPQTDSSSVNSKNTNFHQKLKIQSSVMVKEIVVKKIYFPVYYMYIILNFLGLNINFKTVKANYKNINSLFRILFHIWNFTNIVKVVCFISLIVTTRPIDGSIKLLISHAFQRACTLSNRIFLYMNRKKLKELLIEINTLKNLKTLSRKRFKYIIIVVVFYIQVFAALSIGFFILSSTPEVIDQISSRNVFNMQIDVLFAKIFLSIFIFIYFYINIAFTSLLALIYKLFGNIIRNEFSQILDELNQCMNEINGKIIVHRFYKAVELGNAFDDAMSLTLFSVMSFILNSLFFDAFRLFSKSFMNTYEVSFTYSAFKNTLMFLYTIKYLQFHFIYVF